MAMTPIAQAQSYWGDGPGASLASLLALLRAVYQIHQAAHWQSRGTSYYGDHLLFQRLYEAVLPEIDAVAERTVGTAGIPFVDPVGQAAQTHAFISTVRGDRVVRSSADLAAIGLQFESALLAAIDEIMQQRLPHGTQNLLQGIADTHMGHVYLLQQRLASE